MDFPRREYTQQCLLSVSPLSGRPSLMNVSQSGVVSTRATVTAGHRWNETYGQMLFRRPETQELLAFIKNAWRTGQSFETVHELTPGSGEPHMGTAENHSVTVSGGGQSGNELVTTGWPSSQSDLLLPGTVIKIAGIDRVFTVVEPVNSSGGTATIKIDPSIYVGMEPSSGASITYNDVKFRCKLGRPPELPQVSNTFYYDGLTVHFIEDV